MLDPTKSWLHVVAWLSLVVGLLVFLMDTRSTGEAPEAFKLMVSTDFASIAGAALAVVAATVLVVLHLEDFRRMLNHR